MRNILSKQIEGNYFAFGRDERKLAKLRVCAIFYENAYNCIKRMQTKFKTILSNFKFYARVNARTYAYAHVCAHVLT